MDNKNIFDLENVDDLPDELLKQMSKKKSLSKRSKILKIIESANGEAVCCNQIMVAFYREYKKVLKRKNMYYDFYCLSKQGRIIKTEAGKYKLNTKNKDI